MTDFDGFWSLYPRKVGKGACLQLWKRLSETDRCDALVAIGTFSAVWAQAKSDRVQFCPHPSTWINQRRWEDDPAEWYRSAGVFPPKPAASSWDAKVAQETKEWEAYLAAEDDGGHH